MEREKFRQVLFDYFTFSRSERRGMLVLCALLLLSVIIRIAAGFVHLRDPSGQAILYSQLESAPEEDVSTTSSGKDLFVFNPNTISDSALDRLAIPEKIASNLKRYRMKGGRFREARDVRKLYGMTDSLYSVLLPFIRLESSTITRQKEKAFVQPSADREFHPASQGNIIPGQDAVNHIPAVIELNSADSALLVQLPGIGPVIASRIIRYRNLLGGFTSVDQLSEVYGMTPERADVVAGRVRVDTSMVQPLRINFAGFQQLSRHPYIRKELAGKIMDWRSAKGPFSDPGELLKAGLLDTVQWKKLGSYLTCR